MSLLRDCLWLAITRVVCLDVEWRLLHENASTDADGLTGLRVVEELIWEDHQINVIVNPSNDVLNNVNVDFVSVKLMYGILWTFKQNTAWDRLPEVMTLSISG
jgi:hypothetical protein